VSRDSRSLGQLESKVRGQGLRVADARAVAHVAKVPRRQGFHFTAMPLKFSTNQVQWPASCYDDSE